MKQYFMALVCMLISIEGFSQKKDYPIRKLSIEPALGSRLSSVFGLVDVQVSGLAQYQLNRRFHLASHTAVSFDLNCFEAFKNINVKYSITTFQKFGVGTSLYTKRSSHTLFLMAGGKHFTYSASMDNPKLEDNVNTKFATMAFDKGLLYNLKIGVGKIYFSGRIYAPVFDGKWMIIENTSLEFGVGFQIK